MITDEEIMQAAKKAKWIGGAEGWTFSSAKELRDFARAIHERSYQLGRQHQRESDAALCNPTLNKFTIMTAAEYRAAILNNTGELK